MVVFDFSYPYIYTCLAFDFSYPYTDTCLVFDFSYPYIVHIHKLSIWF